MTRIAVVGLGAMGGRMARRLLDAGHELVVWNRTADKAESLARHGAAPVASPSEAAARADIVITMVADPAALRAVTEGPDGIAAGVTPPTMVIEMSTVGREAISRLASVLPGGVPLLDAPVLGSLSEVESGILKIFVGGADEEAEKAMPVLAALGTPMRVGPLGSGARAKLVANTTLFGVLAVLGEAVALGDGLGLSRQVIFDVLSGTPLAAQAERRRPVMDGEDAPVRFTLSLARKDAELVAGAAAGAGVDVRLAPAALSWLEDAEKDGSGDRDYSAILARIVGAGKR